jgi:hypothetical protein
LPRGELFVMHLALSFRSRRIQGVHGRVPPEMRRATEPRPDAPRPWPDSQPAGSLSSCT